MNSHNHFFQEIPITVEAFELSLGASTIARTNYIIAVSRFMSGLEIFSFSIDGPDFRTQSSLQVIYITPSSIIKFLSVFALEVNI